MVTLDRIRLTGLLRESPTSVGLSYVCAPETPADARWFPMLRSCRSRRSVGHRKALSAPSSVRWEAAAPTEEGGDEKHSAHCCCIRCARSDGCDPRHAHGNGGR